MVPVIAGVPAALKGQVFLRIFMPSMGPSMGGADDHFSQGLVPLAKADTPDF